MTKPESYPFLRIARQYGVEYADVLAVAQLWHNHKTDWRIERQLTEWLSLPDYADCIFDMHEAVAQMHRMQRGEIDWLTGERLLFTENHSAVFTGNELYKSVGHKLAEGLELRPGPSYMVRCEACAGAGEGVFGRECGLCKGSGKLAMPNPAPVEYPPNDGIESAERERAGKLRFQARGVDVLNQSVSGRITNLEPEPQELPRRRDPMTPICRLCGQSHFENKACSPSRK